MDLDKCLEILRSRPICGSGGGGEHDGHQHHHHDRSLPSSASASAAAQEPVGQVIDLLPSAPSQEEEEASSSEAAGTEAAEQEQEQEQQQDVPPEARAEASVAKLREGLKGLGKQGLLAAFRQAQEDRARAYVVFEEGLAEVLRSRDFGKYTGVCAEATAAFAALSNLVNAVEAELGGDGDSDSGCAALLRRVQAEEKEKLSLTAALHLERCRLATLGCGGGTSSEAALLREGVRTLEGRLGAVKVRINEVLEELRYEMAEEEEEGQEE